jgi:hypothetical protein
MKITGRQAVAAAVVPAALAMALAGCRGGSQGASGRIATFSPAVPTSTVAVTGEKDAKALIQHCIPATALGQLNLARSGPAREAVLSCAGVPKGEREAAAACFLGAVEHGGKLPKGRQAKEEALINDAYPCVKKYQGGTK